mmetsp:Transcript_87042/g.269486  ORF Transcript_87042/g.269486 Transcript_87042/m.269486 type:complete len:201 (+) Transcript_87042:589-1191(+)
MSRRATCNSPASVSSSWPETAGSGCQGALSSSGSGTRRSARGAVPGRPTSEFISTCCARRMITPSAHADSPRLTGRSRKAVRLRASRSTNSRWRLISAGSPSTVVPAKACICLSVSSSAGGVGSERRLSSHSRKTEAGSRSSDIRAKARPSTSRSSGWPEEASPAATSDGRSCNSRRSSMSATVSGLIRARRGILRIGRP